MADKWLLGVIQNNVVKDKQANIKRAGEMIRNAAGRGAAVVVLPEMFNCPYSSELFPGFAEEYPAGETVSMLAETARELKIYIFGGSIPELDNGRVYNTCFIFGPDGKLLDKHRKVHLFDVDLEQGQGLAFRESDTLGPGEKITVVDTAFGKIGVGICYDVRFPEMARAMALRGAILMVLPAAFNMITGPAHWEMTMRMRALDNQFYTAGSSPARDNKAAYVVYGHSMVADPWGQIVEALDEKEGLIIAEIDPDRISRVRRELPLLKHRRTDLYELREL